MQGIYQLLPKLLDSMFNGFNYYMQILTTQPSGGLALLALLTIKRRINSTVFEFTARFDAPTPKGYN